MGKNVVGKYWVNLLTTVIFLLGFFLDSADLSATPRSAIGRSLCGHALAYIGEVKDRVKFWWVRDQLKQIHINHIKIFENSGVFPPESQWPEGLGMIASPKEVPLTVVNTATAYAMGVFFWRKPGTRAFGWYSESERGIQRYKDLRIERETESALFHLFHGGGIITINRSFPQVLEKCAVRPGAKDTPWLTPELRAVFLKLHKLGYAHSLEVWGPRNAETGDRVLLAAIYGTFINGHFGGESVYTAKTLGANLGKVVVSASVIYNARLATGEIDTESWIDIQTVDAGSYKEKMGGRVVPRTEFNTLLKNSDPRVSFLPNLVPGKLQTETTPHELDLVQLLEDFRSIRARNQAADRIVREAAQRPDPEVVERRRKEKELRMAARQAQGLPVSARKR